MNDWTDRLSAAMEAARHAGAMLRGRRDFHVENKSAKDFVTDADRASEQMIIAELSARYPEDGFYGEEGGVRKKSEGMWVIDPIDGTTNFIKNIPLYTISIAYLRAGDVVAGAVYAPALDEMFSAVKGGGAFLNGKPIHVSDAADPGSAVVAMSFAARVPDASKKLMGLLAEILPEVNDFRRMGSAAFDLCCVACGRVDAYFEPCLNLYDIAAGTLIVREAGGCVGGWQDEDCLITGNVVAAPPRLYGFFHDRLRLG